MICLDFHTYLGIPRLRVALHSDSCSATPQIFPPVFVFPVPVLSRLYTSPHASTLFHLYTYFPAIYPIPLTPQPEAMHHPIPSHPSFSHLSFMVNNVQASTWQNDNSPPLAQSHPNTRYRERQGFQDGKAVGGIAVRNLRIPRYTTRFAHSETARRRYSLDLLNGFIHYCLVYQLENEVVYIS